MLVTGRRLEDFIKVYIINGDTKKSPLVVHLNQTGFGIEDLAAITCIPKRTIQGSIHSGHEPEKADLDSYDMAFQLPMGTFKREYGLWQDSLN